MDKAISYLQQQHPWLTYAEGFALVMDSYERHKPENKYSGMTKTLIDIDEISDENLLKNGNT